MYLFLFGKSVSIYKDTKKVENCRYLQAFFCKKKPPASDFLIHLQAACTIYKNSENESVCQKGVLTRLRFFTSPSSSR